MVLLCAGITTSAKTHTSPWHKNESSNSHPSMIGDVSNTEGIIELTEALDQISRTYGVYFTFDRELTAQYEVEYEESKYDSAEEAIQVVLKETNLAYQIFDDQFVIIYRNDQAGLKSVKQMISHLQGFVEKKEASSLKRNLQGNN